jgi:hypothetical protein
MSLTVASMTGLGSSVKPLMSIAEKERQAYAELAIIRTDLTHQREMTKILLELQNDRRPIDTVV